MKQRTTDFTQGVIWKQVLLFFVPIMIGSFFQHFYTIVDAMVVGRGLGTAELAAVGGSAAKLIAMITNFFIGISTGVTAYTAMSFGEKDYTKLKDIVLNGLILFLAIGALIIGAGFVFAQEFLLLMGTPTDNMALSNTYLRTYLAGILFCVIYNLLAGILRAMGDAKRPLYVLIFCCFLNIGLDILLALVWGWGVFGVAVATVFSQGVSALCLGVLFFRTLKDTGRYCPHIDRKLMGSIALLGIPAGCQSMLSSFSNMAVQSTVNSFSTTTVASWAAYIKIDGIVDSVLSALSGTVITFVGQNMGAKNIRRVRQSVTQTILISYVIMPILVLFFVLNRNFFLGLFTTEAEVIAIGGSIMLSVIPMYLVTIPQYILSQALRGMGKSLIPVALGLFGSVVLRLSWIYLIFPLNPTITFLGLSYPVISTIMSLLFAIYYRCEINRLWQS